MILQKSLILDRLISPWEILVHEPVVLVGTILGE